MPDAAGRAVIRFRMTRQVLRRQTCVVKPAVRPPRTCAGFARWGDCPDAGCMLFR